jgi:hypothetical protein
MDEQFLLPKARMVDAIKKLPKDINQAIDRINALRNAIAHSLFPENRRQYRATRKVIYQGANVFTLDGFEKVEDDFELVIDYLWKRAFGPRR